MGLVPELPDHSHASKWLPVWAVTSPCGLEFGWSYHHYADTPQKHCNSVVVFKTLGKKCTFGLKTRTFFFWSLKQLLALGWKGNEEHLTKWLHLFTPQKLYRLHWIYSVCTPKKRMGPQVLILQKPAGMFAWITALFISSLFSHIQLWLAWVMFSSF